MGAENVAPGHVYYLGIQYIFTVRPHSQLRRNLLESDGSGASRNNLTTYPNSSPPLVPLDFRFFKFNHEEQKCIDLLLLSFIYLFIIHIAAASTKYFLMADKEIGVTRSWTATCLISG